MASPPCPNVLDPALLLASFFFFSLKRVFILFFGPVIEMEHDDTRQPYLNSGCSRPAIDWIPSGVHVNHVIHLDHTTIMIKMIDVTSAQGMGAVTRCGVTAPPSRLNPEMKLRHRKPESEHVRYPRDAIVSQYLSQPTPVVVVVVVVVVTQAQVPLL